MHLYACVEIFLALQIHPNPLGAMSVVWRVVAAIGGYMTLTMGLMLIDWIQTLCGKMGEDRTKMLWG